jgi:hypothetical protein
MTRRLDDDWPLDEELVKLSDVFRMTRAAATGPLDAGTLFMVFFASAFVFCFFFSYKKYN